MIIVKNAHHVLLCILFSCLSTGSISFAENNQQNNASQNQISPLYEVGIDEILNIMNPQADEETRKQQKDIIISILNGEEQETTDKGTNEEQVNKEQLPQNLVQLGQVSVSDEEQWRFRSENLYDLNKDTEWAAQGSHRKWVLIKWDTPVDISQIELIGRSTDQNARIWNSEFIFSDGNAVGFGSLNPNQTRSIDINKQNISWLKYYIHEGQNNVGLSELIILGKQQEPQVAPVADNSVSENLAQSATIEASSSRDEKRSPEKAVDLLTNTEWVAGKQHNQWIKLQLKEPSRIEKIKLTGRKNIKHGKINDSLLLLSDGSVVLVGSLNPRQIREFDIQKDNISWVKFFVRESQKNAGLSEIEVIGSPEKLNIVEYNLAQDAQVKVSDQLNKDTNALYLIDRDLGTSWLAKGTQNKWISLHWEQPINISTVRLINNINQTQSQITASDLILSNGLLIPVGKIEPGQEQNIKLNQQGITWLKLYIRDGLGNAGLSEVIVR